MTQIAISITGKLTFEIENDRRAWTSNYRKRVDNPSTIGDQRCVPVGGSLTENTSVSSLATKRENLTLNKAVTCGANEVGTFRRDAVPVPSKHLNDYRLGIHWRSSIKGIVSNEWDRRRRRKECEEKCSINNIRSHG